MLVFRQVAFTLVGLYYLVILGGSIPALRDNPRVAPVVFRASTAMYLLIPGVGKSLQYIMYTFLSNVLKKPLYQRMGAVFALFIMIEVVTMLIEATRLKGINLLENRAFMSPDAARYVQNDANYNNLRSESQLTDIVDIQVDVIRDPYLRLFVAYPRQLDEALLKLYQEPVWPDSLSRQQRRERRAGWRLNTLSQYFGVYVNDSPYQKSDFLFTELPAINNTA